MYEASMASDERRVPSDVPPPPGGVSAPPRETTIDVSPDELQEVGPVIIRDKVPKSPSESTMSLLDELEEDLEESMPTTEAPAVRRSSSRPAPPPVRILGAPVGPAKGTAKGSVPPPPPPSATGRPAGSPPKTRSSAPPPPAPGRPASSPPPVSKAVGSPPPPLPGKNARAVPRRRRSAPRAHRPLPRRAPATRLTRRKRNRAPGRRRRDALRTGPSAPRARSLRRPFHWPDGRRPPHPAPARGAPGSPFGSSQRPRRTAGRGGGPRRGARSRSVRRSCPARSNPLRAARLHFELPACPSAPSVTSAGRRPTTRKRGTVPPSTCPRSAAPGARSSRARATRRPCPSSMPRRASRPTRRARPVCTTKRGGCSKTS